jgi:hypothetical protein
MGQIREAMAAENGSLRHALRLPGIRGQLRIVVKCRNNSPTCWSMSVILYSNRFDGRIDCIDWEGLFVTMDGGRGSGFHRHKWDHEEMSCEKSKIALPRFTPTSVEEFILQGFALFGITVQEEGSANDRAQMRLR